MVCLLRRIAFFWFVFFACWYECLAFIQSEMSFGARRLSLDGRNQEPLIITGSETAIDFALLPFSEIPLAFDISYMTVDLNESALIPSPTDSSLVELTLGIRSWIQITSRWSVSIRLRFPVYSDLQFSYDEIFVPNESTLLRGLHTLVGLHHQLLPIMGFSLEIGYFSESADDLFGTTKEIESLAMYGTFSVAFPKHFF